MRYHTPYKNLKIEGQKDLEFLNIQLKNFKRMLAVRAFTDLQTCKDINESIELLKGLIKECKTKQQYLEGMDSIEYKAYITKLRRDIENPYGEEESAEPTDTQPSSVKRQVAWTSQG